MGEHLQIGEVAERTKLSLRTIRHYEEVGLVPPSARSKGGFRLYAETDVQRLLLIRKMKPLGFTLEEMAGLLAVPDHLLLVRDLVVICCPPVLVTGHPLRSTGQCGVAGGSVIDPYIGVPHCPRWTTRSISRRRSARFGFCGAASAAR